MKKTIRLFACVLFAAILLGAFTVSMAADYPYYSEIFVKTKPDKTTYKVGESFDPAGLVMCGTVWLSASQTDTYTLGIGNLKWSPESFTSPGSQKVTLSLSCKGSSGAFETFKTSITVTVQDTANYPYYSEIFVSSKPDKTSYSVGESFDPAGLELSGTVWTSAGHSDTYGLGLNGLSWSPKSFTTAGSQKVKLSLSCKGKSGSYETFTTSLSVNVTEKQSTSSSGSTILPKVSKPVLTKSPTAEKVNEGGSCSFVARADYTEDYEWIFVNPSGKEYTAKKAKEKLPGLKTSGTTGEKLKLSSIPLAMDGWSVYCSFSNAAGTAESKPAKITVKEKEEPIIVIDEPAPKATAAPEYIIVPQATATPEPTPVPTETPHVHIVGPAYSMDGNGHFKICLECGERAESEPHTFSRVTLKQATKKEAGLMLGTCSVCGYTATETLSYTPAQSSVTTGLIVLIAALSVLAVMAIVIVVILIRHR